MKVLGLMSGTSVDGIDAAIVDIQTDLDGLSARVLAYSEAPIDDDLRRRIHALFSPETSRVDEVCEVNVLIGDAFARAAQQAIDASGEHVDLIASHGQTVWHQVAPGHTRSTLQIGEPSVIAERLRITTVADFRPRDIAAGGQGAPLASWGDALLFGDPVLSRAVQNIGGIGNVTWVPPGARWSEMLAFDTGPGNALIDHAVWRLTDGAQRYDVDGRLARAGHADKDALASLLAEPYFAAPPPKTTGRELFGSQLIDPLIETWRARGMSTADVVATLTAFTAQSIADQYRRFLPRLPDEIIIGGGGSRNPELMRQLAEAMPDARMRVHEDFGLPSLGREAVFFALMGHEALFGRPNTVPSCTGASHPVVMGKIVPGANYAALLRQVADSAPAEPRRLVIRA